ncbi:MAG: hypothetical protein ABGY09_01870 [Euryarchaeota archaeon]
MRRATLLLTLALAPILSAAPAHAGQLTVSIHPTGVSERDKALPLYQTLERKLTVTVTVSDAGTGTVRDLDFNPMAPTVPVTVSVTGPVTVVASVRYAEQIVAKISVWPPGRGAFSSVDVPEGRLEVSLGSPQYDVGEGTIDVSCPITVTLRSDEGSVSAELRLRVTGKDLQGVKPPKGPQKPSPPPSPIARLTRLTLPILLPVALAFFPGLILAEVLFPGITSTMLGWLDAAINALVSLPIRLPTVKPFPFPL